MFRGENLNGVDPKRVNRQTMGDDLWQDHQG
jgi:hypothetical protein